MIDNCQRCGLLGQQYEDAINSLCMNTGITWAAKQHKLRSLLCSQTEQFTMKFENLNICLKVLWISLRNIVTQKITIYDGIPMINVFMLNVFDDKLIQCFHSPNEYRWYFQPRQQRTNETENIYGLTFMLQMWEMYICHLVIIISDTTNEFLPGDKDLLNRIELNIFSSAYQNFWKFIELFVR